MKKGNNNVQKATDADFAQWLELSREVEYIFGPMVAEQSFHSALAGAISDGRAFCIRSGDGKPGRSLKGGILISLEHNRTAWLAISEKCRRQGFGSALLSHALSVFNTPCQVIVRAFSEGVDDGAAARLFYRGFGFRPNGAIKPNSAGIPTEELIKDMS